jgi:hypothetical protein
MTTHFFMDFNNLVTVLVILVFAAMTTCFYGVNYHSSWSKFDNTKGGTKKHHMDKGKEPAIVSLH